MAPRTVGRYRLERVLGVGMFSKVMLCVDERSGARYAMKIMRKETLEDMDMAKYARREAYVLRRLSHPGVIPLVEAVQSDSKLFLVMPVAPGEELLALVADGPLCEDSARIYIAQLVDAVGYLHKRGIAHRDLKPENVIADKFSQTLKLIDFGLTGVIRKGELMRTVCGSSFYSAPEVTYGTGNGYDGAKADAWSVGVLSYILLTAVHPFVDEDGELLVSSLKEGSIEFPEYLSKGAVHFLSRLLAVNCQQRYSVAQASLHPWLTGRSVARPLSPSSSRPSAASSTASARPRRHEQNHEQHSSERHEQQHPSRQLHQRQAHNQPFAQTPTSPDDADSGSTFALGHEFVDDPDSVTDWHRNSITSALSSNASIFSSPSHLPSRSAKRPGTFAGPFHAPQFFGRSATDRNNHSSSSSLAARKPVATENDTYQTAHTSTSSPFSRLRRLAGGVLNHGDHFSAHVSSRVDSELAVSDVLHADPIEHDGAREGYIEEVPEPLHPSIFSRFSIDASKHFSKDTPVHGRKLDPKRPRARGLLLSRRTE